MCTQWLYFVLFTCSKTHGNQICNRVYHWSGPRGVLPPGSVHHKNCKPVWSGFVFCKSKRLVSTKRSLLKVATIAIPRVRWAHAYKSKRFALTTGSLFSTVGLNKGPEQPPLSLPLYVYIYIQQHICRVLLCIYYIESVSYKQRSTYKPLSLAEDKIL